MVRKLFIALSVFALLGSNVNLLANDGDVHARDLNKKIISILGHVGIEFNNNIYEMLGDQTHTSDYGYTSNFFYRSLYDIKHTGYYHGAKYDSNINAYQSKYLTATIYRIGATYTKWAFLSSAPDCYSNRRGNTVCEVGKLRCDTLVKLSLQYGNVYVSNFPSPIGIMMELPNWRY